MNWVLLKNSLAVGGLSTLLAASIGVAVAMFAAGLPGRWRSRVLAVAIAALALPPFLVTNCWLDLLGWTGTWKAWLGVNLFSIGGTSWVLALMLWPISTLAAWSAWRRLEPALLESDLAVHGWHLLRRVLMPLARIALAQAAALTLVLALNNFAVPAILQVKVFPVEMWIRFNTSFDASGAFAMSWPLAVGPVLLLIWFSRRGAPWPHFQGTVPSTLFRQQLGPVWFAGCGVMTLFIGALSFGLPLFQLIRARRTWIELPGALAAGAPAIWNSFWFATVAASIIVGLSLVLGANTGKGTKLGVRSTASLPGLGARLTGAGGRGWGWLLWLPFLLPGVLIGIGLIEVFNRRGLSFIYQSVAIVFIALGARYAAIGWHSVREAVAGSDRNLADAARIEGATRWQMLRYVYWPQLAPRAAAAWYIIFLLCLWDVESLILVIPPGCETLALRIFNLLHYGHNAQVNALCLALLGLALGPLLLWKLGRAVLSRRRMLPLAGLALLLAGCSDDPGAGPVHSRIFSRVEIIGSRGVGVGQMNKPRSVALDSRDRLYVVDMTGRVQQFNSNGAFLASWQMPQTDLGRPKGMCRDLNGNIVVVEPHYSRVNHYSPEGKLLFQWGTHGTNRGELVFPRAIAIDSHNEAYLSEYGIVERVQRFRLGGSAPEFLGSFGSAGNGPGEFNRPEGLCLDSKGLLYVADSCNHRIQIFDSSGKWLRSYGKAGRGLGELSYPYDICVDQAGRQYVCEFGNSRIQVFDAQDRPLEIIGGPGAGPGQFNNPWGVALDSAGNLYVADSRNHRVQKLVRR